MMKYKCKNFADCSKAQTSEDIEVEAGTDAICECGWRLEEINDASPTSKLSKLAKGGIGALLAAILAAGGWAVMNSKDGKSAVEIVSSDAIGTPPSQGIAPNESELMEAKKRVDEGLKKGEKDATAAAELEQKKVIAREFVKASIPLMQAGKWVEADAQLNQAKASNPDEPLVYVNLAITQLKQGKSKEALQLLETAFDKGYRDFDSLAADADLKKFTRESGYKALVVRYQAK